MKEASPEALKVEEVASETKIVQNIMLEQGFGSVIYL